MYIKVYTMYNVYMYISKKSEKQRTCRQYLHLNMYSRGDNSFRWISFYLFRHTIVIIYM